MRTFSSSAWEPAIFYLTWKKNWRGFGKLLRFEYWIFQAFYCESYALFESKLFSLREARNVRLVSRRTTQNSSETLVWIWSKISDWQWTWNRRHGALKLLNFFVSKLRKIHTLYNFIESSFFLYFKSLYLINQFPIKVVIKD